MSTMPRMAPGGPPLPKRVRRPPTGWPRYVRWYCLAMGVAVTPVVMASHLGLAGALLGAPWLITACARWRWSAYAAASLTWLFWYAVAALSRGDGGVGTAVGWLYVMVWMYLIAIAALVASAVSARGAGPRE